MTLKMVTATNGRAAQAALLGLRLLLGVGGQVTVSLNAQKYTLGGGVVMG